jgi:hypothetical protein
MILLLFFFLTIDDDDADVFIKFSPIVVKIRVI